MMVAEGHAGGLVFVTLGTDHHPFDRLVHWVDAWLGQGGGARAHCLVQTGRSRIRPSLADAVDFLDYSEMESTMKDATAVVTHGGPGSIALAVALGKRPLVVPRRKSLGEHVDDHQVVFARRIATEGTIELAESEAAFHATLDRLLTLSPAAAGPVDTAAPLDAVARLEALVDELFDRRPREPSGGR
jgi:UDP-N-acetylglucosamine transferase subunit ALG13